MNVKSDFTFFKNNPNLVYLDSAATSLTPDCVVNAMSDYYLNYRATVNRSTYENGVLADNKYNEARTSVAKFLNTDRENIVFVRSTTSGMNFIARELLKLLSPGDEIITSELEHHSTLLPFREYGRELGIDTKYIAVDNGSITIENIKRAITDKTKVLVLHHVSNVIGDRVLIDEVVKLCQAHNIITVFDGAQAISHEQVDVKEIGCDFYVFSGHKILGPTGIGVVYGKTEYLKDMVFEYGGDMAHLVKHDSVTLKDLPVKLEAGTPSVAEIIGLGAAVDYLMQFDMVKVHDHITELKRYMIAELEHIQGVVIYNKEHENGLVTFNIDNLPAHDALSCFGMDNVAIRGGHMCNQLTLNYLGVNSVLRASIYIYNDKSDIDVFIKSVKETVADPMRWIGELF